VRTPASTATAKAYLAETLDWLNLWHNNSPQFGSDPANDYNATHNNKFNSGGFSP